MHGVDLDQFEDDEARFLIQHVIDGLATIRARGCLLVLIDGADTMTTAVLMSDVPNLPSEEEEAQRNAQLFLSDLAQSIQDLMEGGPKNLS